MRHETRNHELDHYDSKTDDYTFHDRTTEVRLSISHYVRREGDRDFARADIHFGPVDDNNETFISAQQIDAGRGDPFWTVNIGPATLYMNNDDRRRLIDALIDGEWL